MGVVAVAGAWWLLLAITFLWNRGDDVGRLPALATSLVASLGRGPVWSAAGFLPSLAGTALAALIGLAWYGLGDAITRRLPGLPHRPAHEDRTAEIAELTLLGAAVWSLVWFLLGTVYLYRVPVAVMTLLAGLGLAAAALARDRPGARAIGRAAWSAALVLVVTTQVLALVAALAPPTAKDTVLYHFALPKAYIAAGGGIEVPYNIASYYPLGVELHAVWAMLLGAPISSRAGEAAAGATLFLFAPLLVMVVHAWARQLVWITVGIGGALSIKLSAAFVILPLALLALLRALAPASGRAGPASGTAAIAGSAIVALSAGVALAAPWYTRNWIRTGSPLFPFYLGIWPAQAPGWDLERSRLYETLFSLYGSAQGGLDYLLSPLRLAVAAQPDQPQFYDGVLGIAIAFALPLLAWALWRRRLDVELRLAVLVSACLFVFWLFSSQQLRYLLPALPGLAVAIAAAGATLGGTRGRALCALILGAAALGVPVTLAWFLVMDPARVVLGGEDRPEFLRRRLDYYPYYEVVNRELPPTAKVWLINMRRDTYHLERPYFSDFIFEDYTLTRYVRAAAGYEEIRARVRADGITHLLVRHDLLFDYRRSPIVDERRTREENEARLTVLADFFSRGTRLVKGDQKFWLIELPGDKATK